MSKRNPKAKRNDNLIVLSHEHHHGLIYCNRLTKANKTDNETLRAYVLDFWEKYLVAHFENEEKVFIPFLDGEDLTLQFLEEHKKLFAIIEKIKVADTDLRTLVESYRKLLYDHIRFEERVFFPWLEQKFTPEQLAIVGELFVDMEVNAHKFTPKFWEA